MKIMKKIFRIYAFVSENVRKIDEGMIYVKVFERMWFYIKNKVVIDVHLL